MSTVEVSPRSLSLLVPNGLLPVARGLPMTMTASDNSSLAIAVGIVACPDVVCPILNALTFPFLLPWLSLESVHEKTVTFRDCLSG